MRSLLILIFSTIIYISPLFSFTYSSSQAILRTAEQEDGIRIQEGHYFYNSNYDVSTASGVAKFWVLYTTDTSHTIDLEFEINTDVKATLKLYEGAVLSSTGTLVNSINSNRNSTNTTLMKFAYDPTITSSGTLINCNFYDGYSHPQIKKYQIKANSVYLFEYIPIAAEGISNLKVYWYED